MATTFVRQLGAESGVQLNPLVDRSQIIASGSTDQSFAIMMRATRGRIDRPFSVTRSNVFTQLGKGEPIRGTESGDLNEAWVHVVEALNRGAYQAVVKRLVDDTATNAWCFGDVAGNFWTDGDYDPDSDDPVTNPTALEEGQTEPHAWLFGLIHHGCFNDGVKLEWWADENPTGGVNGPQSMVSIRLLDSDGTRIHSFYGSLDPAARDDYGKSLYLPDVVDSQTDDVIIVINPEVTAISAPPQGETVFGYGYVAGKQSWATSDLLTPFYEGQSAFTRDHYAAAKDQLVYGPLTFAYISSGGTRSYDMLWVLAELAFETNAQLRFDVPGSLPVDGAISFVESIMIPDDRAHLCHAYWSPLRTADPTGVNPKSIFGVATLNIALSCVRNGDRNSRGFAPKHYPIAGMRWPIGRDGVTQIYTPSNQELNALARAKINPCMYEIYSGGGRYVFRDSLTMANVSNSLRKLIGPIDMACSIDSSITAAGKDALQLPMAVAIRRLSEYIENLLTGAESSGWLVPSVDPSMGGAAWRYAVTANAESPYDTIDVSYWVRYEGTARQIFATQTITR